MADKKPKSVVATDWRKSEGKVSDLVNTAPTLDSEWSEPVATLIPRR